jgi:hypothetical protein
MLRSIRLKRTESSSVMQGTANGDAGADDGVLGPIRQLKLTIQRLTNSTADGTGNRRLWRPANREVC